MEKNDDVYLVLRKGSAQRPRGAGDSSIVTFEDYAIDLSQFRAIAGRRPSKPRPRNRDTLGAARAAIPRTKPTSRRSGRCAPRLYERLTSPLYALVAGLVAFAALGQARTTRQNRGLAILVGDRLCSPAVRIFGFADALMLRGHGAAAPPEWSLIGAWGGPLAAGRC